MANSGTLTGADVEVIACATAYRGFFTIEEIRLRHRCFGGGWSSPIRRELFVRGESVGVLLYDPRARLVGLVEQFRVGALGEPNGPWLLEVVAGMVGEGETPADVARREALEETGVADMELMPICDYLASPGGSNEKIQLFCGLADLAGGGGIFGLAHENEDILFRVMTAAEAMAALAGGRCNNAATIISLQWLQLNRERLRADTGIEHTTTNSVNRP
ncbi:MAG: NUDIX domain-containing protein [Porticoccaceae bacterium]